MARSLLSVTAQRLALSLDRAFASAALVPRGVVDRDHAKRLHALELVARFYDRPEYFAKDGPFFPVPAPIEPEQRWLRNFGRDGEVLELRWASEFSPLWSDADAVGLLAETPEGDGNGGQGQGQAHGPGHLLLDRSRSVREKYLAVRNNRTAVARWFRHRTGVRPCAVMLHGYLGGVFAIEERMFPVRRLFAGGMDVVLSSLPFHGARRDETRGLRAPAFPSSDPRFTIEGFRQLVFDHRALFDYLERRGTRVFGVMGTSLGGYASALLATLEPRLQFALLFIPLGSLEQFYSDHGAIPGDARQQQELRERLQRAHQVVSPLARPSLVPKDQLLIVAGELDQVTGLAHSRLLAAHFGVPVETFAGGHVLQLGRTEALEPAFHMLERAGLFQRALASR